MAGQRTKSQHITIVDVARESGFSASTVSIVLNEAPLSRYVAATTKEQIRSTAERLGYHPDLFARSLRSRRTHTIGVMIFDISDPFCTLILRGIERALHGAGYLPLMMDAHNNREQFEGYLRMLVERRIEGLIVVANWLFQECGLLARLQERGLPIVVVGRDLSGDGFRSVVVENEAGGYMAIQHLYDLGHRAIATIRGPVQMSDSSGRWAGIQRFCAGHNLAIREVHVRTLPDLLDPFAVFETGAALADEIVRADRDFTALIGFDDLTALGAMRGLTQAGVRVPHECSVIGFDDIPAASFTTPGLTTIRQPMEEMGAITTEHLLKMLSNPEEAPIQGGPLVQKLAPVLIARGSTMKAAGANGG
ncbi:MAG TPA: LacI family DNA-binding transcriptional regulator [Acidobacteriaceae bacterium]|nr:LacI family DNA-binding transcriptional regulator [Acidobacteriaceae bacterium]